MKLGAQTKAKLVKLGGIVFPAGIVLLVIGTVIQVSLFITSEGKAPSGDPSGMVWGGIIAAIGIPAIVGGKIMQMIGKWEHEKVEEETPPNQNV